MCCGVAVVRRLNDDGKLKLLYFITFFSFKLYNNNNCTEGVKSVERCPARQLQAQVTTLVRFHNT